MCKMIRDAIPPIQNKRVVAIILDNVSIFITLILHRTFRDFWPKNRRQIELGISSLGKRDGRHRGRWSPSVIMHFAEICRCLLQPDVRRQWR